jgi:DNA-directed RNA polymerase beta subunit
LKEFFEKPNPLTTENYRVGLDPDPYEMLEEDGLGMIGSWATENHAIIGKTSQVSNLSSETKFIKKDQSIMSRPHEQGRFDKIMISDTPDGYTLVKVKMREERVPKEGDKLSSMHSQKGVMGALRRAVDMPFIASSGIVPDLVINSHALPSRMTLSQILEMVVGKACSIMGELGDGTSYEGSGDDLMEVARRVMVGCGQASSGCEVMINGETGEMYTSPVFVGVCRYLKLKNDPMEKFTCRDKGQVQLITRQPVEGRLRNGGLRFGEMEKDCVVSYGAAHLMKNIFVDNSDATKVVICKLCKLLVYEDRNGKGYCRSCNSDKVFKAIIPYTTKYLYDQLRTKNIVMRFGEKQIENVEEIELEEGQIMDDGDIAPEEPFMGISSPSEVEVY